MHVCQLSCVLSLQYVVLSAGEGKQWQNYQAQLVFKSQHFSACSEKVFFFSFLSSDILSLKKDLI